jgi:asparagine synthase (glutamine-hydrolysing)
MCGIVVVAGPLPAAEGEATVARMSSAIVHRGPDDEGSWACDGFAFGMRRLSIIDLASGHQPMWTKDGVGVVMNGEIYNYRALRTDLERDGYDFQTTSDTEVLLKVYHRYGLEGISLLEGMFGVCLYDPREGAIHLVRDRLGKKPLYYCATGDRFYAASELKAILAALDSRPALSRQAIHDYLTLRFVPSGATIWEGIRKLEPGHILTYRLGTGAMETRCYWRLAFQSAPLDTNRDYLKEFTSQFLAAVEKRLVAADVPVGVLLSGGLDSSAVGAVASVFPGTWITLDFSTTCARRGRPRSSTGSSS